MKVLAIETSCDETGIAVVEGVKTSGGFEFTVVKNALLSQAHLHAEYGGVYPNLAKREHEKNLPLLFEQFKDADYDAIAVTQGPGLEPALWQGIVFAEKLAKETGKPLLPTNHMEGHLLSSLAKAGKLDNVELPVLALLISGGHTEFVLMKDWFKYEIIGETLDDAVGEAFDKVARMLGLGYPGGPVISKLAAQSRAENPTSKWSGLPAAEAGQENRGPLQEGFSVKLPRPMLNTDSCDVSFSGLKTAALYALRDKKLSEQEVAAFAREFEDAVTDVFIAKTTRALEETGAKTFVIGGGVAANLFIRESLQKLIDKDFSDVEMRLPELSITGDNAIMIAEAALARALSDLDDSAKAEIRAVGNLSISSQK
ncbi:MAG: tRNA (adenosine(37)-N6)-threonylcarbamoyltransferase complex transferase subunit TsaD [Candidatus Pacebacteria bacterium]|nr:tRNA (adenosine(37)-N6)-threonylcarbamoyltransferase complex transferase subunit TsaD [Candidatus Paceibacterota bacterium]